MSLVRIKLKSLMGIKNSYGYLLHGTKYLLLMYRSQPLSNTYVLNFGLYVYMKDINITTIFK